MPILVTGGAGFIGSHVADALRQRGHPIVVLDDLSGGTADNVPDGVEFVPGSILDEPLLNELFERHRFRYVYHFAAYAAEGLSHFIRRFNYMNNVIGSVNLINLAVRYEVERFVFTSSIAVYGAGQTPMTEALRPAPEDPYGIAKFSVEQDLACAGKMFGLRYTIFRPHNVYGERQRIGDRYRNVVGIFMNQIARGEPLTILGDGAQTRAFTYIDDVVGPMLRCLDLEATVGEVFNVGADTPYSVNDLAEMVMRAMGRRVPLHHADARQEVVHAFGDHSKLRRFFADLRQPVSLQDGLARMAAWVRARGSAERTPPMQLEIDRNLPGIWRVG